MSKVYNYTLGIDIGVASIGTALMQIDKDRNPLKILDAGVRIFNIPEGAEGRRTARLMRKHIRRRRQRIAALKKFLQAHSLLPESKEQLHSTILKNPYELRAFGVSKPYESLHEMGRSFLHMSKFRGAGFLDQLEETNEKESALSEDNGEVTENTPATDNKPKKDTNKKDTQKTAGSYRCLEDLLKTSRQSLSEFFVERLNQNRGIRRRTHLLNIKEVEYAVPRFLVKDEFWKIWNKQTEHHKNLTPEMGKEIYDLIFKDHPHAPYATGSCTFYPNETRLPKFHRLSEKRRIYEQINNIRYDTTEAQHTLDKVTRDALVKMAFEEGKDLNKTIIKKIIQEKTGEKVRQINLDDDKTTIKGFVQIQAFKDIASWHTLSIEEQDAIIDFIADPRINPNDENSELHPDDDFTEELCKRLELHDSNAGMLAGKLVSKLGKDRSNLGKRATLQILEKLEQGDFVRNAQKEPLLNENGEYTWRPLTHREAANACGLLAEEEEHRKLAGTFEQLPYYGQALRHDTAPVHPWHKKQAAAEEREYGRIPNPVVHVALNQLRKVVNEIVALYGKPQSIHMEFARELGKSPKERKKMQDEMLNKHKENEKIDEELRASYLTPNRTNRTKFKLWKEQNKQDLYAFKPINIDDLSSCEIDHIIPQSLGGTDTYMNLALVHKNTNQAKGNRFAYDFIQAEHAESWSEISKLISSKHYPQAKAWRLGPKAQERFEQQGDEAQTDHRLTDTSYMAKIGARYLSLLCDNVVKVKGGTTSYLRHLWGLDGLEYELLNLPISKWETTPVEFEYDLETGEVFETKEIETTEGIFTDKKKRYLKKNPLWNAKPRIDHRHHAIDAIVTACTNRNMVSKLVRAEKEQWNDTTKKRIANFEVPFGGDGAGFREQVKTALQNLVVSPKPEHGKEGQLHKETKYRILSQNNDGSYLVRYHKSISDRKNKKDVEDIWEKAKITAKNNPQALKDVAKCARIKENIELFYSSAEDKLEEEAEINKAEGKKIILVNEQSIVSKAITISQQKKLILATYPKLENMSLVAINKELQFGFEARNNFCMDFFEKDDGEIGWECLQLFNVNDKNFVPKWKENGGKLIWSLYKGDTVEVYITTETANQLNHIIPIGKHYLTVQKLSTGDMSFNLLHDARALDGTNSMASSPEAKETYKRLVLRLRSIDRLTTLNIRKIDLTPFGKIQRKHKRLWHGKKSAPSKPL